MFKQILTKLIYGVPPADVSAALTPFARSARPVKSSGRYVPASSLTEAEIEGGIGDDGSCYAPWRVDSSGQAWFERISGQDSSGASIRAFLPTDDFDDFDDEFVPRSDEMILRDAKLKFAELQVKRRMHNWPMDDDSAFEDSDNDQN